jgi:predicted RNA binding protein YcfA (HicA-like mRNA interferase family)
MPALRPVYYQRLVRVFEHDDFHYDRTEGDHLIYVKEGARRPLVIPMYCEIPVFIIKNLPRTSGMSPRAVFRAPERNLTATRSGPAV